MLTYHSVRDTALTSHFDPRLVALGIYECKGMEGRETSFPNQGMSSEWASLPTCPVLSGTPKGGVDIGRALVWWDALPLPQTFILGSQ